MDGNVTILLNFISIWWWNLLYNKNVYSLSTVERKNFFRHITRLLLINMYFHS
jgi:hypothetical protein